MLELLVGVMAVGPLMVKNETALSKACTAFLLEGPQSSLRLVTANHCVLQESHRIWFPELSGNAFKLSTSNWKVAHPLIRETSWLAWGGSSVDIAYVSVPPDSMGSFQPLRAGQRPVLGERLYVLGYPKGVGPERFSCRYDGVVVLKGVSPLVRPSLRCFPAINQEKSGLSGGPVLNDKGQVIGVLSSGTFAPEGGYLLGFEFLDRSGLEAGTIKYPYIADENKSSHVLTATYRNGNVAEFKVQNEKGTVWTFWP